MSAPARVVAAARALGDPDAVADRVAAAWLERPESYAGDGRPTPAGERAQVLADGVEGLAKLAGGHDDELDEGELLGLEAIVLLEGRPAITVRGGDFEAPPHGWERLRRHRDRIRAAIAAAGRIEVRGDPGGDWAGSGALVAADVVLTNRHVVQRFCERRRGGEWAFLPAAGGRTAGRMRSCVDFAREAGAGAGACFAVSEVIGVHERHDLALLRVAGCPADGGAALPAPLAVAAEPPRRLAGRDVYVVGHPARDDEHGEPEALRRIFADVYDVKRVQPGQALGWSRRRDALRHDCSTLGGNSGSPVLDLETHLVLGLHFSGRYGAANYAVPLWRLRDDGLLKEAAVGFA